MIETFNESMRFGEDEQDGINLGGEASSALLQQQHNFAPGPWCCVLCRFHNEETELYCGACRRRRGYKLRKPSYRDYSTVEEMVKSTEKAIRRKNPEIYGKYNDSDDDSILSLEDGRGKGGGKGGRSKVSTTASGSPEVGAGLGSPGRRRVSKSGKTITMPRVMTTLPPEAIDGKFDSGCCASPIT